MDVLLYTWPTCGFCERARALLREAGIDFEEQELDRGRRDRLAATTGKHAMPYALVDGELLGGLDELRRACGLGAGGRERS